MTAHEEEMLELGLLLLREPVIGPEGPHAGAEDREFSGTAAPTDLVLTTDAKGSAPEVVHDVLLDDLRCHARETRDLAGF